MVDKHLSCPSWPACDEAPLGCRFATSPDKLEEYGHKDEPDLFQPHKLRRNTDPDTSARAAEQAEPVLKQHHQQIMFILNRHNQSLNAEQIADQTTWRDMPTLNSVQVARRIHELLERGLIVEDGEARQRSGRMARCFRAKGTK